MISDLIAARERAMDRADAALDSAWPERSGAAYVEAMQAAAADIRRVAVELEAMGAPAIEQSRTRRYLGSIYSDLAPALGPDWLARALDTYFEAERLLPVSEQGLERAKLEFNFGNTLRQLGRDDPGSLNEAMRRLSAAREVFAKQAPQYLPQVEQAMTSVDRLLTITPIVQAVRRAQADLDDVGRRISEGADLLEVARDLRRISKRDGGVEGLIDRARAILTNLPTEMKSDPRFAEVNRMIDGLKAMAPGGRQNASPESDIASMLRDRLKRETRHGSVDPDRAATLDGLIGEIERIFGKRDDSIEDLIDRSEAIRKAINERIELLHYLSHGIERPPTCSRAAAMVEECWLLRRFLAEEMNQPDKGPDETRELEQLAVRGSNVDRRIYEAGADDARAGRVEAEEFRPFATAVRAFSARAYTMFARPIWTGAGVAVDTNALLYSGPRRYAAQIASACRRVGMKLIEPPAGSGFADARWQQIQRALVGVFDFRAADGAERAAVAYEFGIALTLGRPVVILVEAEQMLPFDVDRDPVVVESGSSESAKLEEAIRAAIVSTYASVRGGGVITTLDETLSRYRRPHDDVYVDQTLRLLAEQQTEPDRLTISRTLAKLVQFLGAGGMCLISPAWPAAYPDDADKRLFHVMPFSPCWATDVADEARAACRTIDARYIRGDEVTAPDVIRSIWEELARATHVLVDLTGFNANVALELGIAHTLGRSCMLVGQGSTVRSLFPMIAKQRLYTYSKPTQLGAYVTEFLK
jgi:hypothetical protein